VLASDLPGTRELARHFPDVQVMSLDADDDQWAAAAARLLERRHATTDSAARFANGPFAFERSCEAHYEVWSGAHA
jgi:hypothetical protein